VSSGVVVTIFSRFRCEARWWATIESVYPVDRN
jgi:hypothetical protein